MKSSDKNRTVLMLLCSIGRSNWRRQSGAQRVASARGWIFHAVFYAQNGEGGIRLERSPTGSTVAEILKYWHPDGCIAESPISPAETMPSGFGSVPTVFIENSSRPPNRKAVSIGIDNAAVARAAADELFKSGFDDYAFVPWPENTLWSVERGREFRRLVKAAGRRFHVFAHPPGAVQTECLSRNLATWLRDIPKPVGVFAANDAIAEGLLLCCADLGLSVPDEVAVIGVDDIESICENARPTLSSIRQDWEGQGRTAAELLSDMMDAPGEAFASRKCGTGQVVRRESTRFEKMRDWRVAKGLEFIRLNACGGIGPDDVARVMGVCRRGADEAFRKAAERTILDEIHAVRLAAAREMLARGIRPDIVAQDCGYSSVNDFRRVFRKRVGLSILQWLARGRS